MKVLFRLEISGILRAPTGTECEVTGTMTVYEAKGLRKGAGLLQGDAAVFKDVFDSMMPSILYWGKSEIRLHIKAYGPHGADFVTVGSPG